MLKQLFELEQFNQAVDCHTNSRLRIPVLDLLQVNTGMPAHSRMGALRELFRVDFFLSVTLLERRP